MLKKKRLALTLGVLMSILTSITPLHAQPISPPHFGTGVVILARSKYDYMSPVLLSPSGHWFAAVTYPPFSSEAEQSAAAAAVELHLWDLHEADATGTLAQPEPAHSLSLTGYGDDFRVGLAFSPDERYLAVHTTAQVILFTLPAFQEHISLSVGSEFPNPSNLSWSPDGNLLAILTEDEIVIWNVHTDAVVRHNLIAWYGAVRYFNGEWLIRAYSTNTPHAFVICTIDLDLCVPYVYPGVISVVSPSEGVFVGHRIDSLNRWVYGIWTRREDGAYLLDEATLQSWNITNSPEIFSPQGTYLYVSWQSESDAILQWDTLQVVARPPKSFNVVWTPDEAFVALRVQQISERNSTVTLYDVGQDKVADTLDLRELGIKDLWHYIDPESIGPRQFSADGRWLLFNLGRGALLIPIVYE